MSWLQSACSSRATCWPVYRKVVVQPQNPTGSLESCHSQAISGVRSTLQKARMAQIPSTINGSSTRQIKITPISGRQRISAFGLVGRVLYGNMSMKNPVISMKCKHVARVQTMVGMATDKSTLNDKKLLALHSAYLDKEDLQQKIDKLHVEYKHLSSMHCLQKFAADRIADCKIHTH